MVRRASGRHLMLRATSFNCFLRAHNGTPYLFSSSPTRRRRAGEEFFLGTEIHGFIFNKGTAWLRIDIYPRHFVITACFASSRLSFPLSFFVHRLAQIITDFLISKDIVIITDYY